MPELRKAMKETYVRLFGNSEGAGSTQEAGASTVTVFDSEDSDPDNPPSKKANYGDQVSQIFEEALISSKKASSKSKIHHLDDEITLASKTGELTEKLKQIHLALTSIPAASIESERAFSIAGSFATKIRSRLSDETLDRFSFAKSYFKNQKLSALENIVISWFLKIQTCL
jgi:hypothetical protein